MEGIVGDLNREGVKGGDGDMDEEDGKGMYVDEEVW